MEFEIDKPVEKVVSKLDNWIEYFVSMMPNILVSILLMLAFYLLAKMAQKLFFKVFSKTSDNVALQHLFSTIIYYIFIGLGLFIILSVLKLDKAVGTILAGIGVIGLAIGFAFQDIAANFISGIILAFRTPFFIGDVVQIKDQMGTVARTNLRVTIITTFQGQEVYIPNKEVLQSPIINYSILGKRRIDLPIGVSYSEDLEKVQSLVLETVNNVEGVIDKENTIFDYESFGDSSINLNIRFWIEYPDQPGYFKVLTNVIIEIKKAFDKESITIPFPIRTLDFGSKGGTELSEMALKVPTIDSK
jgi:small conductance mechanosensitive channel